MRTWLLAAAVVCLAIATQPAASDPIMIGATVSWWTAPGRTISVVLDTTWSLKQLGQSNLSQANLGQALPKLQWNTGDRAMGVRQLNLTITSVLVERDLVMARAVVVSQYRADGIYRAFSGRCCAIDGNVYSQPYSLSVNIVVDSARPSLSSPSAWAFPRMTLCTGGTGTIPVDIVSAADQLAALSYRITPSNSSRFDVQTSALIVQTTTSSDGQPITLEIIDPTEGGVSTSIMLTVVLTNSCRSIPDSPDVTFEMPLMAIVPSGTFFSVIIPILPTIDIMLSPTSDCTASTQPNNKMLVRYDPKRIGNSLLCAQLAASGSDFVFPRLWSCTAIVLLAEFLAGTSDVEISIGQPIIYSGQMIDIKFTSKVDIRARSPRIYIISSDTKLVQQVTSLQQTSTIGEQTFQSRLTAPDFPATYLLILLASDRSLLAPIRTVTTVAFPTPTQIVDPANTKVEVGSTEISGRVNSLPISVNGPFTMALTVRDSGGSICDAISGTAQVILDGSYRFTGPIVNGRAIIEVVPIYTQPNVRLVASIPVQGKNQVVIDTIISVAANTSDPSSSWSIVSQMPNPAVISPLWNTFYIDAKDHNDVPINNQLGLFTIVVIALNTTISAPLIVESSISMSCNGVANRYCFQWRSQQIGWFRIEVRVHDRLFTFQDRFLSAGPVDASHCTIGGLGWNDQLEYMSDHFFSIDIIARDALNHVITDPNIEFTVEVDGKTYQAAFVGPETQLYQALYSVARPGTYDIVVRVAATSNLIGRKAITIGLVSENPPNQGKPPTDVNSNWIWLPMTLSLTGAMAACYAVYRRRQRSIERAETAPSIPRQFRTAEDDENIDYGNSSFVFVQQKGMGLSYDSGSMTSSSSGAYTSALSTEGLGDSDLYSGEMGVARDEPAPQFVSMLGTNVQSMEPCEMNDAMVGTSWATNGTSNQFVHQPQGAPSWTSNGTAVVDPMNTSESEDTSFNTTGTGSTDGAISDPSKLAPIKSSPVRRTPNGHGPRRSKPSKPK